MIQESQKPQLCTYQLEAHHKSQEGRQLFIIKKYLNNEIIKYIVEYDEGTKEWKNFDNAFKPIRKISKAKDPLTLINQQIFRMSRNNLDKEPIKKPQEMCLDSVQKDLARGLIPPMKNLRSVIFRKVDKIKDEYEIIQNIRTEGNFHIYRRKSDGLNVTIKKVNSYNIASLLILNNGNSMVKCYDSVECEGDQWIVTELMADDLVGFIKYL